MTFPAPHRPRLVRDDPPPPASPDDDQFAGLDDLPDAETLADAQRVDTIYRLHEDATQYPVWPWPSLADLAGPLVPEDLILVAARTGGGKSLFLQNAFDGMIADGRRVLYVGLEQSPKILRAKWACLRTGVPPKLVLAPRRHERGTPAWHEAMRAVQADVNGYQFSDDVRRRAFFAAARTIDRTGLRSWCQWAAEYGCEAVIVDHVDRMDHGDGRNAFAELSRTIRLAKELAVHHGFTMVLASQVGRPKEALEPYMPVLLHELRGAGTKEEESDTVLGIHRPLRPGVATKDMNAVRMGLAPLEGIREENAMRVQLLKHRLDGPVAGQGATLRVHHGRVTSRYGAD